MKFLLVLAVIALAGCKSTEPITPSKHVIILVDKTDDFTINHQQQFESSLREHERSLGAGDRLTIYELTPTGKTVIKNVFDKIRPKKGEEANWYNENKDLIEERYNRNFMKPFEQAVVTLRVLQKTDSSPILEALHAIAHDEPLSSPASKKVLEIWSDMVAQSTTINQFKSGYDFKHLVEKRSMYLDVPTLTGIEMRVKELRINEKYHTEQHVKFWTEYCTFIKTTCQVSYL